ncbi:MAG: hypothetical protein CME61_02080 [Halobacteriovoraceae bacterium]|nr:hypothetical protein [Halobacteriovoraceae bacterium]
MRVVYSNFDDFVKKNKSILQIISDQKTLKVLKSCWEARDGEILKIKKRTTELEGMLSNVKGQEVDLSSSLNKKDKEIFKQTELINEFESIKHSLENQVNEEKAFRIEAEKSLELVTAENLELEKVNVIKDQEIERLERSINASQKITKESVKKYKELKKRDESFESAYKNDRKYIKELERQLNGLIEKNNEYLKVNEDFKFQTNHLKYSLDETNESYKKLQKELGIKEKTITKMDSRLFSLSEKINNYQNELTILQSKSKKQESEILKLSSQKKEQDKKLSNLYSNNQKLLGDNRDFVDYTQNLKSDINQLERVNNDLMMNQEELENYIKKIRLKANRDSVKVKELQTSLSKLDLEKKVLINEKNILRKEVQHFKAVINDVETRLLNPQMTTTKQKIIDN